MSIIWPQPQDIENIMMADGFSAIRIFKDTWQDLCKDYGYVDDINIYWNECAKEIISSFGSDAGVNSNRGQYRNEEGFYRSNLLDDYEKYFTTKSKTEGTEYLGARHPLEYVMLSESGKPIVREVRRVIRAEVENAILSETHPGISESEVRSSRDVRIILMEYCKLLGFSRATRGTRDKIEKFMRLNSIFELTEVGGVGFFCSYDYLSGINVTPSPIIQCGFINNCGSLGHSNKILWANTFKYIIPGVSAYNSSVTPRSKAKGIFAFLSCLITLRKEFQVLSRELR